MLIWAMDQGSPTAKATYRLFWTNGSGRIDRAAEAIDAESDDEAVRHAERLSGGRAGEVWLGSRRVAMLNGAQRAD